MKKITLLFLIIFSLGCGSSESKNEINVDSTEIGNLLDSIISNNNKNFELTNQMNKQSDSVVSNKVENTVKKITNLETQVTQLKKENNELKEKLDDVDDGGKPYSGLPVSGDQKN